MPSSHADTVFVVDDDNFVRQQLTRLLAKAGWHVQTFASGAELLAGLASGQPGCLLLDVSMPGMSGLELQTELRTRGIQTPVVFLTGHGTIPMAVDALRAGAVTFLEKPFVSQAVVEAVTLALNHDRERRRTEESCAVRSQQLGALTQREREVLEQVVNGLSNKEIARVLGISFRTVEYHRANLMAKLSADSVADLIRLSGLTP